MADPQTPEMTVDQSASMLENSLKLGAKLGGYVGAIFVAIVDFTIAVLWIGKAIKNISEYYEGKGRREQEAYQEAQMAKLRAQDDQARRELDNYTAYKDAIEQAWQVRLEKIIDLIKLDQSKDVLLMCTLEQRDRVSPVLYDSTKTIEGRATEVLRIMRGK